MQPPKPVVQTVDRGPVKLTVTAARNEISIAERLDLRIEVHAEPGIEVQMPDFGESLAEFQIRDFRTEPARTAADGRQVFAQVYDLDIFLSGEYSIPGITARYRKTPPPDQDAEAEPEYAELSTEPIKIQVKSLLAGEFDPQKFHGPKPVAELPRERGWGFIGLVAAGALLGLCALGGVTWYLVRRALRPGALIAIPPDEWALNQLRALAEAQLVEQGRVQEFYYRLSEIARRYLELRFGLMAPERTTEEFLLEMRGSAALSRAHQNLVGEFLEACDLVKYARHEPATAEIEAVFNAARDLVLQTRPAAQPSSESAGQPAPQEMAA
jgi:hypothetical protein